MKNTKTFNSSGSTPRETGTARNFPTFITRCVAGDLLTKMCFPLRVTLSKLASRTARKNGDGERKGANFIAISKCSASTDPTRLHGHEGRVSTNELIVRHRRDHLCDNFPNSGIHHLLSLVTDSHGVLPGPACKKLPGRPGMAKNCARKSHFQPSHGLFSTLC